MKILGCDTAAKTASVALTEGGRLVSEFYLDSGFTHSETVLPMAKALLEIAGTKPEEIDVFAVNCGTGSFTGLRIGIAAVKAMAMSLKKPCAAVSTLEALAENLIESKGVICPVMDARCNQMYTAFFKSDGETLSRICDDRTVSTDALFEDIEKIFAESGEKIMLVGDGAELCARRFESGHISVAPPQLIKGHAFSVCRVAERISGENALVTAEALVPNYLKLAQAEKEKLEKEGKL